MTYIELINNFWKEYESKAMKPNDVLLYFYLLKECNRNSWRNPFELPTKRISTYLEMTNKTIVDCRNRLIERGLIEVQKGDRNKDCPVYFLVSVGNQNRNQNGTKPETKTEPKRNQNGTKNPKIEPDTSLININSVDSINIKTKTKTKTKEKEKKKEKATQRFSEGSFFSEKELSQTKSQNRQKAPQPSFPTLEDVKRHFLSVDAPNRIENWEQSAIRFYENFSAVGWRDKYNRLITRWDSRANSWILSDEEKQKKEKHDEKPTQSTQRPDYLRRDVAADSYEERQRDAMEYIANNLGKD